MKEYIKIVIIAIGSSIAIKLNTIFMEVTSDSIFSIVMSSVIAIAIFKILEFILLELPIKNERLRYLLFAESQIEGCWIVEFFNSERPYSLAWLSYDPYSKSYTWNGIGFDSLGNKKSIWRSDITHTDLKYGQFDYIYTARLIDQSAEVIKGFGVNYFDSNDKLVTGTGFIVDAGTTVTKNYFNIDRFTKEKCREILGIDSISTNSDMKKIIIHFCSQTQQDNNRIESII